MVSKKNVMIEKVFLLILGMLIGVGIVFASVAWITQGGTSFSFNETDSQIYNITIDITDVQLKNVTRVNITLPTGFTFENNSNITNVSNVPNEAVSVNFSSIGSILSWTNDTIVSLINSSQLTLNQTYFAFNATASTPGAYNFIVDVILTNGTITTSNVSIRINDTTAPTIVAFVSPGLTTDKANLSQNSLPIKITVTDEGTDTGKWLSSINISLYNASLSHINSSLNYTLLNVSDTSSAYINFTGLSDGTYYINATVNDTQGNINSSITLNITLDTTAPTITFSCDNTLLNTGDTTTCTCTATDATSGVSGAVSKSNIVTTSADYLKTYCSAVDYAGNNASASIDYTVTASGTAVSTGNGGVSYTKTYVASGAEFEAGYTKTLKKNEKIRVKVYGKTHNIGVTSLTSTTATISVFSTPQEAILTIGDTRKFDVLDDGFYDISVKLNKIEGNKAEITIKSIHEEITEVTEEEEAEKEVVAEELKEEELRKKRIWTWIIIGIIVVVILAGVGYKIKKKG